MKFQDIFNEWTDHALKRKMRPRDHDLERIVRLSRNKLVALTGMRRSGKSSLLMLVAQWLCRNDLPLHYINMEDMRIRNSPDIWDSLDALVDGHECYLLLDEVTAVTGWEGWLMRAHEMRKDELHVIVTSSCSKLVYPPKELRGRVAPITIFPLSFREMMDFHDVKLPLGPSSRIVIEDEMQGYLTWGGCPEVALQESDVDKVQLLSSYYEQILAMDLAAMDRLDMAEVKKVGAILLRSPYFSSNNVLALLKSIGHTGSKQRLLSLEQMASDSFLFHFDTIFSYNIKDRLQYPRKCYCGDNGFFLAVAGDVGRGRLWENAVFLSMRRHLGAFQSLHYWKDRSGREVDLVLVDKDKPKTLVQVCSDLSDPKVVRREVDALVRAHIELSAKESYLVNPQEDWTAEIEGVEVRAIPLSDWLLSWPGKIEKGPVVQESILKAIRPIRRNRPKD